MGTLFLNALLILIHLTESKAYKRKFMSFNLKEESWKFWNDESVVLEPDLDLQGGKD